MGSASSGDLRSLVLKASARACRPARGKGQFSVSGRLVGCRSVFGLWLRLVHVAGPDVIR